MIIPPSWNLPGPIKARLGDKTFGRQRIIFEEGHLLIILHKIPTTDETQREGVLFWRTPDGNWKWTRGTNGAPALGAHVQSYIDREAALAGAFDESADTKELYDLQTEITPIARSARNMHNALQAARDAVKSDKLLIEMRDRAYETERNLELLLEDVRNMIQYRTVREAEEQSRLSAEAVRASHRLNLMAAFFLPLTTIAALFGMNVASGAEQIGTIYFWLILIVGVCLGASLKAWVVGGGPRRKRSSLAKPPKLPINQPSRI